MKRITPRKSGASVGQWDAYLFAPDGTKIRQSIHGLCYNKEVKLSLKVESQNNMIIHIYLVSLFVAGDITVGT